MKLFNVTIGEVTKQYAKDTSYQTIAEDFQNDYENKIVLVMENGYRLQELRRKLKGDCALTFVTTADNNGFETFRRSMCMLMIKAVHDVGGHDRVERVRIHFSVGAGYYCTVEGDVAVSAEFIRQVSARMKELVEAKIPIGKRSIHTEDALQLFHKHQMYDKERLFKYRRVSTVNIYSINEFEDYFYGYMVPNTSYLDKFALHVFDDGFTLQMPTKENSHVVPPFQPSMKLFKVRQKSVVWGDEQKIRTVGALNDMITHTDMREMVLVQEAYHERQIADIAREIANRAGTKFVLIAGPSSSGKTTFSHRLSIQLRTNGMMPHPIGVDNYFVDREKTPKDEDGNYNFECIEAIDIDSFNKDMADLLLGKEVVLPTFDFKKGKRHYDPKNTKQLGEHDVLVIEGIHCLNPKLTASLSDDHKFKIYISPLTQLKVDEHNMIPSREGRLVRRIVRDTRTRGISASATINMWASVKRGEEQYIFPFQEEADIMFNSSLPYELAVLKQYVEPLLFAIEKDDPAYVEAKKLLKFFDYFVGISSENIPSTSLLREFVGGGCFYL
ncbi:MAG: nucleoside kinase [Lachnospiraceae bacterium]|nr:nucleoside kinase [Lachnospiraceae bacterium]